jgi:hypothetical protein
MTAHPAILDRLRGVQRAGRGWVAFCPGHDDQAKRSLSVGLGDDGRTLLKCHAVGCTAEAITHAVQMTLADLAPPGARTNGRAPARREVASYDYTDERGTLHYQAVRYEPKDFRCRRPDGRGGWLWNLDGVRAVPYRLHELAEAARVFVAEGEKDVDALAARGLVATCNHGGAGKWREEHTAALMAAAVPEVVVVPDNDSAGETHALSVARSCTAAGLAVKLVRLPGLPPKGDVSDWLAMQRAAGRSEDEIRSALTALADAALPCDLAMFSPPASAATGEATIAAHGDDYTLGWPDTVQLLFVAPRESSDGIYAELTVRLGADTLSWGRLNLASTSMREGLVKKLREAAPDVAWRERLELACREIATRVRAGAAIVALEPAKPAPGGRYLVEKLLPLGETAVLYGDGGVGKGWLELAVGLIATCGGELPGGLRATNATRVLLLDYESTLEEQQERLYFLSAALPGELGAIEYRAMTRPIADEAAQLRREIARRGIGLVIVDSLGPACGGEPESAEAAIRAMNALRTLSPATRLVIAHVSKASADNHGPARPYGSVFVQNLARSTWEVRRAKDEDDDLVVALYHRKANHGRLHPPISLRLAFTDSAVTIAAADLGQQADLMAGLSITRRILHALRAGPKTEDDLVSLVDAAEGSVARLLRRLRKEGKVQQLVDGGAWSLAR